MVLLLLFVLFFSITGYYQIGKSKLFYFAVLLNPYLDRKTGNLIYIW